MGATAKKTALTLRKKLDRFFYVLAKKLFQTGLRPNGRQAGMNFVFS